MARAGPEGNGPKGLFPSLLRGLWTQVNPVDESVFQQGFDALVEFLEGGLADDHVAVDEKGRGPREL